MTQDESIYRIRGALRAVGIGVVAGTALQFVGSILNPELAEQAGGLLVVSGGGVVSGAVAGLAFWVLGWLVPDDTAGAFIKWLGTFAFGSTTLEVLNSLLTNDPVSLTAIVVLTFIYGMGVGSVDALLKATS